MTIDFGPLEALLKDEAIMEIMITRYDEIYYEKHGRIEKFDGGYESEEQLLAIVEQILTPLGRVLDESHPIVDARLPDGSRVNVVGHPISLRGTTVTIRKMAADQVSLDDLLRFGCLTEDMVSFIRACIVSNLNVAISGGTGSGKTTVLNIFANMIPDDERIVVIENAASLRLKQPHLILLESRPANLEGHGEISMRDLMMNSLRMRPDRIIVGEVNGAEALELLQAMNTGHDGSMFSLHANTPRDALSRLEVMCTMGEIDVPILAIREQMAAGIDIIVQQQRLRDGSRKILSITEVQGIQNNMIVMQDIFEFMQTGFEDGRIIGYHTPTGAVPKCLEVLNESGFAFSEDFFKFKES